MKKICAVFHKTRAVLSLFLIPIGFIFSQTVLAGGLESLLNLSVEPRFSGGQVLARVFDPAGDDTGEGGLCYPLGPGADTAGALDLIRYTVHEPVLDAAWSSERDFWQIDVTLAAMPNPAETSAGFSLPLIMLYIDSDGPASGSTQTLMPLAELVAFDPAHPWDIAVRIDGYHDDALLMNADGSMKCRIRMLILPEKNTICVRLPLDIPEVKRILDKRPTWHYVLVAAFDSAGSGSVMPVKETAAPRNGGGAKGVLSPRVYDCLVPKTTDQKTMLSSWNVERWQPATVFPVEIAGRPAGKPAVTLDELERRAAAESAALSEKIREKALSTQSSVDPLERAVALFTLERYSEAETILSVVCTGANDNAVALAYFGSLVAMKAGKTGNPAEAIRLVNESFSFFSRAEKTARTDDERLSLFMNCGMVCLSIPEAVFGKSVQGACDFLAAYDILARRNTDSLLLQFVLIKASQCLVRAGKSDEAEIPLIKAASISPRSAMVEYELAKQGIEF